MGGYFWLQLICTETDDSRLLGCDGFLFGVSQCFEGMQCCWNDKTHSPNNTVSHTRTSESAETTLWKPQSKESTFLV